MITDLVALDADTKAPQKGGSVPPYMQFIGLVEAFFPRPNFKGDKARLALWARSLRDALSGYDEDVLLAAAREINLTRDPKRDGKKFPKPAECIAACEVQRKLKLVQSAPLLETRQAIEDRENTHWLAYYSKERQKLARDLCMTPLGKKAAREGWVQGLFDFIRVKQRVPNDSEIAGLVAETKAIDAAVANLNSLLAPHPIDRAFREMAKTMIERRRALAEQILTQAP